MYRVPVSGSSSPNKLCVSPESSLLALVGSRAGEHKLPPLLLLMVAEDGAGLPRTVLCMAAGAGDGGGVADGFLLAAVWKAMYGQMMAAARCCCCC